MCGITGFTGFSDPELLERMNQALYHRGPDDQGYFYDNSSQVSLAMRRLSIIDIATGKQPMSNEDKNIWLVANGEIYNSPELRLELIKKGHRFKTYNSDVEVILHLYEEKGTQLIDELNGMFAFVIYDRTKRIIFGCRDRLGIKPFYYVSKDAKFAFASELKSLLLLPWVSKTINFNSVYHYISLLFIPAPETIYLDIKKLEAGHFFIYDLSSNVLENKQYWNLDVNHTREHSVGEWKEIIRSQLTGVVKRWTLSDVPVACSLSGGIDSSAIVGLLAESGAGDIRTYSLGFANKNEQRCNELPLARKVAEKWSTKHHEIIINSDKVLGDIDKMIRSFEQPYAGGLPSWYIYELIAKDVKVCLTGTGGDELFGNYGKWRFLENRFLKYIKAAHSFSRFYSFKEVFDYRRFPIGHYYWRYFSDSVKDELLFKNKLEVATKTEDLLEGLWKQSQCRNARDGVAYVDFKTQLPEEFLFITDCFSMAHSVEARVPYLDHTLVELVFSIPYNIRTRFSGPKYLLKESVKDLLPYELMHSPKKGFVLPLTVWTRKQLKPLIEELLSPEYLSKQGVFSSAVFYRLIQPHLRGFIEATPQVWMLLMFQLWYREYFNS